MADLKQIIIGINLECGIHMIRSGKKQDLIDRLCAQFATWKSTNNMQSWVRAKTVIDQINLPVSSFVSSWAS